MSKSHELAWCAGFFDGDGYVYVNRVVVKPKKDTHNTYTQHRLRIGINHVAIEPLLEIARILGGEVRVDKSTVGKQKDGYNRKIRHVWFLNDEAAKKALISLLPYMRNKNKVAELGIELRNTFVNSGGGTISQETIEKRDFLKSEITRLNSLD